MTQKLSGGCLRSHSLRDRCRSYRHELSLQRLPKASGSGYAAIILVPKDAVKLRGEVRFHGSSGKMVERGFCPNCGSPVIEKAERLPSALGIPAGSLDDPTLYRPSMDLYTDSAPPWDSMLPDTTKFPRGRSA
jgi:hypothetical protein